MTHLPQIGDLVKLYPAPLPDAEVKSGRPLALRRVQDGAGNHRRFLPDEGAERVFDDFWHNAVARGDVCLTDPRVSYTRGTASTTPTTAPPAPVAPATPKGAPTPNP